MRDRPVSSLRPLYNLVIIDHRSWDVGNFTNDPFQSQAIVMGGATMLI